MDALRNNLQLLGIAFAVLAIIAGHAAASGGGVAVPVRNDMPVDTRAVGSAVNSATDDAPAASAPDPTAPNPPSTQIPIALAASPQPDADDPDEEEDTGSDESVDEDTASAFEHTTNQAKDVLDSAAGDRSLPGKTLDAGQGQGKAAAKDGAAKTTKSPGAGEPNAVPNVGAFGLLGGLVVVLIALRRRL